jgi:5-methyltetrahydropteroyltriglutamate--homocysteine methyltransferase
MSSIATSSNATSSYPSKTSAPTIAVATLGTPRIGPRRELKQALESFWSGATDEKALLTTAAELRAANWARQKQLGVTIVPSNDFSLYDQVLDTSVMVGAIPDVYGWKGGDVSLATYFAMARGAQGDGNAESCGHTHHADGSAHGVPAQEMTKWFDTNYHYMVPELRSDQTFTLASRKPIEEYEEAKSLGYSTRPVLIGPVTFLKLAKSAELGFDPLALLDRLLPVYVEVLRELAARGAEWVQLDEPCLVLDLDVAARDALRRTYATFADALPALKIMLTSYFGGLGDNLNTAMSLPVAGLHIDLVRAPNQLDDVLKKAPKGLTLSLGIIDGRNIWRANLPDILNRFEPVVARRGADQIQIAPSCSLLHVPIDLEQETGLDPELWSWLAFSVQKMSELAALGSALARGRDAVKDILTASLAAAAARKASPKVLDAAVTKRMAMVTPALGQRGSAFAERAKVQRALQAAALPHHHHRLVSANDRCPQCAGRACAGRAQRRRLQDVLAEPDRAYRALAGKYRARCSRAWRIRAQRHGAVFWRAACRLRLHQAWLGAILRLALCAPAGAVR